VTDLRLLATLLLWALLCGTPLAAEEPSSGSGDASPAPAATSGEKQAETPAQAVPPPAAPRSPETFMPSQEISEDLSVSFPVDI
jgi:hypothetical protein